ncbi:DUF676 domain-containing protein [Flavobacterium branchiophilum]|uniref:DUF676 domain-containing protein n=1 Tax=Flavobacterium branchiophilum (strain FL-15) TaxID=1034807 RepID=G2Z4D5_FLABF|nr:hypothetical protein [Flavobacterium branchiophilum]CCB68410.1 Protein of unknown function precursor [Flavobacterium branchiophilum FL-15]
MKNLFISILCFISTILFAQEKEPIAPKDYTVAMDSLLKFVKKDQIKTGLLYDRVVANANLLEFNNKERKQSSSYWHYIQALSEVHRSSLDPKNKMQYEIVEYLRHKNDNVINISYINTSVDYIDYGTKEQPNLIFKDGYFYNVEDRNPFKQKQVTVVGVIAENINFQEVKIVLNQDMLYQDDSNPIKNLTAIINGAEIKLVSNFENSKEATGYTFVGNEKEILFKIEFKNETKIQTSATIMVSLPQTTSSDPCYVEDFIGASGIDHNSFENTDNFQGYNESTPIKGVLEYRTYFNKVTNTCNTKKINKPVIILDGFDPGDGRKIHDGSNGYNRDKSSLYELMAFDHDNNIATPTKNFVDDILVPQGFDVTLVNFPQNKMIDPVNPTSQVWVQTGPFWFMGHWTTVTNYKYIIDGGADFIERNAMALVALLKRENAKLVANGSTEQITLIGPSMGGLISRYALAYMEKNNIPHNVKLWVSFDSPHLGANIPIATQAQLLFLGTIGESAEALEKYKSNLQSPAARQMLIEQVDNYPSPTSMWSNNSKNNNHPFRQQFLQNQISNSISNSNGFPTSMRKISLINGTTNGLKTNAEGQLVYDVAVFGSANLKGFYNVDRNQATPGNSVTTFEGRYTKKILCGIPFTNMTYLCGLVIIDAWRNDVNINPRGCMDVVPGGTFNTVGIIKKSIDENPDIQENRVENRMYIPNHAFIPTVSSLAFKNPNFDWSTPLNRNLVCNPANKEIVFDSYFSPSKNEEHVALTKESVDWLLTEIQGNQQAPYFPIPANALSGPSAMCINTTATFTYDICKIPSAVSNWAVTPDLQIISSDNYSITVKALFTNPSSSITATFSNGLTNVRSIILGTLQPTINGCYDSGSIDATCALSGGANNNYLSYNLSANLGNYTPINSDWQWEKISGNFFFNGSNGYTATAATGSQANLYVTGANPTNNPLKFRCRVKSNNCWSAWKNFSWTDGTTLPPAGPVMVNFYQITPIPVSSTLVFSLKNASLYPSTTSPIIARIYNQSGMLFGTKTISGNPSIHDISNLPSGYYIAKITYDNFYQDINFTKQ